MSDTYYGFKNEHYEQAIVAWQAVFHMNVWECFADAWEAHDAADSALYSELAALGYEIQDGLVGEYHER